MEIVKQNILFLVFNRIEPAKKVLKQINYYKPQILYVSCDGWRNSKEKEKVLKIRQYIINNTREEIKLITKFNDTNLGCKIAVSSAINWFFSNEDSGIILEDDCLPNKSFFEFMNLNLTNYRNDDSVISINGCNLGFVSNSGKPFKTTYMNMWGWGTWKKSSNLISYDISNRDIIKNIPKIYQTISKSHKRKNKMIIFIYWIIKFFNLRKINTWDYQWIFFQLKSNKLSISPGKNLVSNIGFNDSATHTTNKESPISNIKTYDLDNDNLLSDSCNQNFIYEDDYATKKWENITYLNTLKGLVKLIFNL